VGLNLMLSTAYAAASATSQRQENLMGLILAAGSNPTPESISAAREAQVLADFSVKVEGLALAEVKQTGAELADLGRAFDSYA